MIKHDLVNHLNFLGTNTFPDLGKHDSFANKSYYFYRNQNMLCMFNIVLR